MPAIYFRNPSRIELSEIQETSKLDKRLQGLGLDFQSNPTRVSEVHNYLERDGWMDHGLLAGMSLAALQNPLISLKRSNPAMRNIVDAWEEYTEEQSNLIGRMLKGTIRTAFVAMDSAAEKLIKRPIQSSAAVMINEDIPMEFALLELIPNLGFITAKALGQAPDTTMNEFRAKREAKKDELGPTQFGVAYEKFLNNESINLGTGFFGNSVVAEDTELYKRIAANTTNPQELENARRFIQQQLGDPITVDERNRVNANTYTFADGTARPISPGLVAMHRVADSADDRGYRITSGIVDGLFTLGLDPANVAGGYWSKVRRLRKQFPSSTTNVVKKRLMGNVAKRFMNFPGVEDYLNSPVVRELAEVGAKSRDISVQKSLVKNQIRHGDDASDILLEMVDSKTPEEWIEAIRKYGTRFEHKFEKYSKGWRKVGDDQWQPKKWKQRNKPQVDMHKYKVATGGRKAKFLELKRDLRTSRIVRDMWDMPQTSLSALDIEEAPFILDEWLDFFNAPPEFRLAYFKAVNKIKGDYSNRVRLSQLAEEGQLSDEILEKIGGMTTNVDLLKRPPSLSNVKSELMKIIEDGDKGALTGVEWFAYDEISGELRKHKDTLMSFFDKTYAGSEFPDIGKKLITKAVANTNELKRAFKLNPDTNTMQVNVAAIFEDGGDALVDGVSSGAIKAAHSATTLAEYLAHTITLPDPRELNRYIGNVRNAFRSLASWDMIALGPKRGVQKTVPIDKVSVPIKGTRVSEDEAVSLVERAWQSIQRGYKYNIGEVGSEMEGIGEAVMMRYLNKYMTKIWKPFALLRWAWTLRVVGEEQVRMWTEGLDSMFRHPISYFAFWVGDNAPMNALNGNMNNALKWKLAMSKGHGGYIGVNNFSRNREYRVIGTGDKRFASGWLNETLLDNSDDLTREIDEVVMSDVSRYASLTPDDPNVVYVIEGVEKGSTIAGIRNHVGDILPDPDQITSKTVGHIIYDLRHNKISADTQVANFIGDVVEDISGQNYEGYLNIKTLIQTVRSKVRNMSVEEVSKYQPPGIADKMTRNKLLEKTLMALDDYVIANSEVGQKITRRAGYKEEWLEGVIDGSRTMIHSKGADTRVAVGKILSFVDKKTKTLKYFRVVEVKQVNLFKNKKLKQNQIQIASAESELIRNGYSRGEASSLLRELKEKVDKLDEADIALINKEKDLLNNFIGQTNVTVGIRPITRKGGFDEKKVKEMLEREKQIEFALEAPTKDTDPKVLEELNKELREIDEYLEKEGGEVTSNLREKITVLQDKKRITRNRAKLEQELKTLQKDKDPIPDAIERVQEKLKRTDEIIEEANERLADIELRVQIGESEPFVILDDVFTSTKASGESFNIVEKHEVRPEFKLKALKQTRAKLEKILSENFGRRLDLTKGQITISKKKRGRVVPLWAARKESPEALAKKAAAEVQLKASDIVLTHNGRALIDMGVYQNVDDLLNADYSRLVQIIRALDKKIVQLKKIHNIDESHITPTKLRKLIKSTDEIAPELKASTDDVKELEALRLELDAVQGKIDVSGTNLSLYKLEPVNDDTLDLTRINGQRKAQLIISGGQTGVDKGALVAARKMQYKTGGMAPKNYVTDEGAALDLQDEFGLAEDINFLSPEDLVAKTVQLVDGTTVRTIPKGNFFKNIGWRKAKDVEERQLVYLDEKAIPQEMKDLGVKVGDVIKGETASEKSLIKSFVYRSRAIKNVDNADVQIIITSPRFSSSKLPKGRKAVTKGESMGTASTFNYATEGRWGLPRRIDLDTSNTYSSPQDFIWLTDRKHIAAHQHEHLIYSANIADDSTHTGIRKSKYKDTIVINIDKVIAEGGLDEDTMVLIDNILARYENPVINVAGPRERIVMGAKPAPVATVPVKDLGEVGTILGWSRYGDPGVETFEVSTKGDSFGKQFSALNAKFADGESVELKWAKKKGYKSIKEAKGKEAIHPDFPYYEEYLKIWNAWVDDKQKNFELMEELAEKTRGKQLTDFYANTDNNQARALSDIINQRFGPQMSAGVETVPELSKELLQANPDKIYVFGDNWARTGKGGQAIIRDEPNAFGIATKKSPRKFLTDDEFEANKQAIDKDIEKILAEGKTIVLPEAGIGTGRAGPKDPITGQWTGLENQAPRTAAYLEEALLRLKNQQMPDKFPNIPDNIQKMEMRLAIRTREAQDFIKEWEQIEQAEGIKLIRGKQFRIMDDNRQKRVSANYDRTIQYTTNVNRQTGAITLGSGTKKRAPRELKRRQDIELDYRNNHEPTFWKILDEIESLENNLLRHFDSFIPEGEIVASANKTAGPNRRLQQVTEDVITQIFEPSKSWGGLQGLDELVERATSGDLLSYFQELADDAFRQSAEIKQKIIGNKALTGSYIRSRIADRHRLAGGNYDVYIKHADKPDFAFKLPSSRNILKDKSNPKFEQKFEDLGDKLTLDIDGVVQEFDNFDALNRSYKDRFYIQTLDEMAIPKRLPGDDFEYANMQEMFESGYYLDYDITRKGDPELLSVFSGRRPFEWGGKSTYVGQDMGQHERRLLQSYLNSKKTMGLGPRTVKVSKTSGELGTPIAKWDAFIEDMFDGFMSAQTNKFSRSPAFMQYYLDWFIQNSRFMPMQVKEQIVASFESAWDVIAKESLDVSLARRIVAGARDAKGKVRKSWVDKTLSELKIDMELHKVGDGIDIDSIPKRSRFKQNLEFEASATQSGEKRTSMEMIENGERTSFTTYMDENKIPMNGDIILLTTEDGVNIPVQVTRVTPYEDIRKNLAKFTQWAEDEGLRLDWASEDGIENLFKAYQKTIDTPLAGNLDIVTEKGPNVINVFRGKVSGGNKLDFGNPFFHNKEKVMEHYEYLYPLQTSSYKETVGLYKRWLYGGDLFDESGNSNLLGRSETPGEWTFPWFKNGDFIDDARTQRRPEPQKGWDAVSKWLDEERKRVIKAIDDGYFDGKDIFYKRGFKDPKGEPSHADVLREFILERRPDAFKKAEVKSVTEGKQLTSVKFRYYSGRTFTTFEEADELAKSYALTQTKNLLYDLNRRGQILDALRLVFPFGEAYKEILTTQARLMSANPHKARRASIVVQNMQDDSMFGPDPDHNDGFFAEDPVTGEQMYNFADPGGVFSGWVVGADPEDVGIRAGLRGYTRNLNMMATTIMPGVGPVVQIPASLFNVAEFGFVADQLFPFGRPEVRHGIEGILDIPKAFATATIPPYMKKMFAALNPLQTGIPDPADQFSPETSKDMVGILASTTKDLLKVRTYAGTVDVSSRQGQRLAIKEAVSDARWLSLVRGAVQWMWFTGGEVRYEQAITDEGLLFMDPGAAKDLDPDARFTGFANLVNAYYKLYSEAQELIKNNPEYADMDPQYLATKNFEILFGSNPMPLLIRKTREITEYPMGDTGLEWARENPGLFAEYPNTAVFGKPYDEFEEFDVRAWRESLTKGARIGLTPNDWLHLLNQANGRMAYQNIKYSVKNNPEFAVMDPMARQHLLAESKLFIMAMFPGFGQELTMRKPADLETKIAELRRWEDEPMLHSSEAGKALTKYLTLRDALLEEYRLQTGRPMSTLGGKSAIVIRNQLRVLAKMLINQYPEFRYVYNSILSRELEEDIRSVPEGFEIQGI
tara:strand:- start:5283 stop:16076 length:10794 start_codon:yes stop_codon:yes gene_type:complete